jgi:hypothetical protein
LNFSKCGDKTDLLFAILSHFHSVLFENFILLYGVINLETKAKTYLMANEKKTGASVILRKILFGILGIILIGLVITFLVFNFTYSDGTRAGVLMKFSKRGYVFKTYEGELNIGGVGNIANTAQVNQVWNFSVKDEGFADSLHLYEGKRVILYYKEKIKHLPWQGETDYFVYKVQNVNQ